MKKILVTGGSGFIGSHTCLLLLDKGYYVIDLKNRVEWLKCSVGQIWENENCIGDPVKLTLNDAKNLTDQVSIELGGEWRLPNKKELMNLICKNCENVSGLILPIFFNF